MDKKRRNRFLIALACMALVIGVFALITVVVTSTTMAEAQTQANGETQTDGGERKKHPPILQRKRLQKN